MNTHPLDVARAMVTAVFAYVTLNGFMHTILDAVLTVATAFLAIYTAAMARQT